MCGINGFNFADPELIGKMNQVVSHRGSDDQGWYVGGGVSLGHVRLSIIDVGPAGHQPMFYDPVNGGFSSAHQAEIQADGALAIVFNGEIYNYRELRLELRRQGYVFSTQSDCEVILAAYREWGFDCVRHFNGMWAFAIHDPGRAIIFCSRDRLGVKPLYYYHHQGRFIFSSELKGILQHPGLVPNGAAGLNQVAVDFYFSLGFIPAPLSIYHNVFKLEARQSLVFDLHQGRIDHLWYHYDFPEYVPEKRRKVLLDQGRQLLYDAVRLRLIADVPVGAFLSGGLDSSAVVSSMRDFTALDRLHTFSIGFEGKWDETRYINIAREAFGTIHHHRYFTEDDFHNLGDTWSHLYDEPFTDHSGFPTYVVSRMAREQVKVVLSGDGGDEIFGGYNRHRVAARLGLARRVIPEYLRRGAFALIGRVKRDSDSSLPGKARELFRLSLGSPEEYEASIYSDNRYLPVAVVEWYRERYRELLARYPFEEAVIKFDLFFHTLSDRFLTKVDRASMGNALEVRSPFLDHRFIEFSARIPTVWKADALHTKGLFREMIRDLVPVDIRRRRKQGFTPPIAWWLLRDRDTQKAISDSLEKLYRGALISEQCYRHNRRVLDHPCPETADQQLKIYFFARWAEYWRPAL